MNKIRLLSLALLAACPAAAQISPRPGLGMAEVPCDFPITVERKGRVRCFTMSVPRDRARPQDGTFSLAVSITRASTPLPGIDPVLVLHGGPGGSGGIAFAGRLPRDFMKGADLVIFDHRANGQSEPKICNDIPATGGRALAEPGSFEDSVQRFAAPHLECRARFAAAGLRPEHFGTRVTTADIEQLRRALGLKRWNVMSTSYGTNVALDLLAAHPATVRAAVLDSPVPRAVDMKDVPNPYDKPFDRLFSACAANPACARAHPNLRSDFRAAIADLDSKPLVITGIALDKQTIAFDLNGRELEYLALRLLRNLRPDQAIALIAAARRRDPSSLRPFLADTVRILPENAALGRPAVLCRDGIAAPDPASPIRGAMIAQLHRVCPTWGSPGPSPRVPRQVKAPVLVLVGGQDALIGSDLGLVLPRQLGPKARALLFPEAGHGTWGSDCAKAIVEKFFATPAAALDSRCIAKMQPPSLLPKGSDR